MFKYPVRWPATGTSTAQLVSMCCLMLAGSPAPIKAEIGETGSANTYTVYDSTSTPFGSSFILETTATVAATWSRNDFLDFMDGILDADSTNSSDIFPILQEYFLWDGKDADPSYGGLDLEYPSTASGRIVMRLFTDGDSNECGSAGASCALDNVVWIYVQDTGEETLEDLQIPHELGHILWSVNAGGKVWINELHATMAEYVLGHRWDDFSYISNQFYDQTVLTTKVYFLKRLFVAYIMEHFSGGAGIADDLGYNWVREAPNTGTARGMLQLGDVLDSLDQEYSNTYPSVEGASASEIAGNLFHRYGLAKYANNNSLDSGKYGFGSSVSARDHDLFDWDDTGSHQVRSIAPHFVLGPDNAGPSAPFVASEFLGTGGHTPSQWTEDCRTRQLGMRPWASEYIVLRSDPDYFEPGLNRSKTLNVTIASLDSVDTSSYDIKIGYLIYDASDSVLYDDGLLSVAESVSVSYSGEYLDTQISIPSFGDTAKGVVLVATLVENPIPTIQETCNDNYCGPANGCWCDESDDADDYPCGIPLVELEITCQLGNLLNVGAEYETVQRAIDSASAGDIIVVTQDPTPVSQDVYVDVAVTIKNTTGLPLDFEGQTSITAKNVILEGITFKAETTTDTLVSFQETIGTLRDCFLSKESNAGALIGVGLPDASPTSGQFVSIENTMIDVDTGHSGSYGVKSYQRPVVVKNSVVESSGKGIYGQGHRVIGTTIDASNYAVELWSGSLVENSILVQSAVAEARADTFRYCILPDLGEIERWYASSWTFNNDTLGVSDEDPLFSAIVDDYCLRLDSYGSPQHNPSGLLIGAKPTKYLEGVVARDLSVKQASVTITDDAQLPDSLSLNTDWSGAITFNVLDDASLIIYGEVGLQGTAGNKITFQSDNALPSAGDWDGLAFRSDAVVDLDYVDILHAGDGILVDSGTPTCVRLTDVTVDEFYSAGISIGAADTLEMTDVTITGDSVGDIGILVGSNDAVLTNIEVTGLTTGNGIEIDATGVTLKADDSGATLIDDCKKGIWVKSGSPTIEADTPANDSFDIDGCTTGIYVSGSAAPTVTDVTIDHTNTGIHIVSTGGGTYKDVDITGGSYGMNIDSGTSLSYREGSITGWTQAAAYVAALDGIPDFGTSSSHGENNLHSSSSSYVPLKVKGRMWPTPDVSAQYNWWGQSPPPTMSFVDYSNHLTTASSHSAEVKINRVPVIEALAIEFRPNPIRSGGGVIQLALPEGTGSYRVEVFDVQGRLVRTPEVGVNRRPQIREITWDGTDNRGIKVPSGIYFVRVKTEDESLSLKVVRSQ